MTLAARLPRLVNAGDRLSISRSSSSLVCVCVYLSVLVVADKCQPSSKDRAHHTDRYNRTTLHFRM